ncbi:hypothetical protein Mal64_37720 [Pseudobythopirellula maris]|uniref:Uncharacterized protein n=1 Tax=Pseudobythopirellula maris TaxID=2527991 RepID=A0A5C5ZHU3_9BACT|nr:hypothetical protein [Pseudobythopirellula maris]TWT86942.1 hypothetical protein Mal64_37720 [Pseudobythopirellula maris]
MNPITPARFASRLPLLLAALSAALGAGEAVANDFVLEHRFSGGSFRQGLQQGRAEIPPSPNGAVGPQEIVEFTSSTFTVYDHTGARLEQTSDVDFWNTALASTGAPSALEIIPGMQTLYDPHTDRWYASAYTVGASGGTPNQLLIGVTLGADPSLGEWRGFSVDLDPSTAVSALSVPTLGIDGEGLYAVVDRARLSGETLRSANLFGVPLTSLTDPTPSVAGLRSQLRFGVNSLGYRATPVIDLDGGVGSQQLVSAFNENGFKRTVLPSDWLSGGSEVSDTFELSDFADELAISHMDLVVDQPGGSLAVGSTSLSGGVVSQNGSLWSSHVIRHGGRNAIQWMEFSDDAGQFTVKQSGVIADAELDFYYPSLAVNDNGDVVVGFSGSSSLSPISSYVAVGRTVDGVTSVGDPVVTHAGSGNYSILASGEALPRWGGRSTTVLDPNDPLAFWTFQPYVSNVPSVDMGEWVIGVTKVKIIPEPCGLWLAAIAVAALPRRHSVAGSAPRA